MRIIIPIVVFTIYSFCLSINHSQAFNEDCKKFYQSWINSSNDKSDLLIKINGASEEYLNCVIHEIKNNYKDSIFENRWQNLILLNKIGTLVKSDFSEQSVLSILLTHVYDEDSRIKIQATQIIFDGYSNIKFSDTQKDTVLHIINNENNPNLLTMYYRVCGLQEIKQAIPHLNNVIISDSIPFIQKWAALSVLSRLGDENADLTMLQYLKRIEPKLDVIDLLYPYVMFSKGRNSIGFLLNEISNSSKECESSNPNYSATIPCGYMILRVVAPKIRELKWSGRDGLQILPYDEALKSARIILLTIGDNWSLEE